MTVAWKGAVAPPPQAAASERAPTTTDPKVLERARAYVSKMPEAISGSGGHSATWNAARKLVADFGLTEADALNVLIHDYNPRCQPQWSERELRHKVAQAKNARVSNPLENRRSEVTRPRVERPKAWEPPTPPQDDDCEPTDDDAPLELYVAEEDFVDTYSGSDAALPEAPSSFELSGQERKPPQSPAPTEGPTTDDPLRGLAALERVAIRGRDALLAKAAEPVFYIWNEIIVGGTIVVMSGAPGCGKTTFAFMLMAARATLGEPIRLLGKMVTPAPAGQYLVLVEGEHSEGSAARVLMRSMDLLGVDYSALDRLILIARKAVKLRSPEWRDIERMIGAGLVSDVLIDTIARVAPGDANSESEQISIFDDIAKAIEQAPNAGHPKPTCHLVAHNRKNGNTGDMSDVSGSAQRVGQADTVIMFKAEKVDGAVSETTIVFDKLREPPEEHPKPVSFSIVKEEDGSRRLVTDLAATKAETDSRPAETRVLEFLDTHTEPQTKEEIRKALKLSGTKVEDAITNLFGSRSIRKQTVKRKTGEYPGFYAAPKPFSGEEY